MPLTISGYKFFERSTVYLCNYNFTCSEDVLIHSLCCAALTFALVRLEPFLAPVCVVMFSSYFIYFIQGKGFPLHLFPLNQSAFILQNTILIALYKTIKEQVVQTRLFNQTHLGGKKWLIGTLALTALTAWLADSCWKDYKQEASSNQFDLASIGYKGHASAEDLAPLAKPIIEYTKVGDYVAIIGESTEPNATTILQLRRKSATRHIDLTMLGPFRFVRDNVPQVWQKFPNQLNEFIDQLVQDLKETSPTIVLLQNGQTTDWLSEYKFSQRSLNNYEQIGEEDNFTIYKKKGCFKTNEMWVSGPTKPK